MSGGLGSTGAVGWQLVGSGQMSAVQTGSLQDTSRKKRMQYLRLGLCTSVTYSNSFSFSGNGKRKIGLFSQNDRAVYLYTKY